MKKLGESKEKWHKAGYEDGYRKGVEDAAKVAKSYWDHIPQEEFDDGFEIPKKDGPDFVHTDIAKQIIALLEKSR